MTAPSPDARELPMPTARPVPLEPAAFSTAYRFRSVALLADAQDTPPVARRMARETLDDWELPWLVDDVVLCVSELVGNAVRHVTGRRRIGLTLRHWPRWLFVEVTDEDPAPPRLPSGDPSGLDLLPEHGRGLFIVQSLADATWWAPRDAGGKSVFCRFDTSAGHGAA